MRRSSATLALCAALSLSALTITTAHAQYPGAQAETDRNARIAGAEQQRRQQANTPTTTTQYAPYTGLDGKWYQYPAVANKRNRQLWKEARRERKDAKARAKARKADEKVNGKQLPGGYRLLPNGDIVAPDGKVTPGESPNR